MAASNSAGGKPHTAATLQSVEITWKCKHGDKTMKVDLKRAGGIWWGDAAEIPWNGKKEKFPEAKLAVAESAPVMKMMSSPAERASALCWWDEVLQQWICPEEPDEA